MLWRTATTTSLLWIVYGTAAAVTPPSKAVGIAASQYWEGNDGPWSSFPIRVGNPPQDVRVFVSTSATSTIVVGPSGCAFTGAPSNCTSIRGGTFDSNASTAWKPIGDTTFGLHLEENLGPNFSADEGMFGNDTVTLGFSGSGGPTVQRSTVGWIQTFDFLVGVLGLNPRPTNFTSFNDPQPSYLDLLYRQGVIPSLSYGYTAGAQYMYNQVLGSLTLGGYDSELFVENNVSFPFNFDQTRDLTVALQSINISNGTLYSKGISMLIDSTVSQIWLPLDACEAFESTFGLIYDPVTQFYLVNETQHTKLAARNENMTFTLSPTLSASSSQRVNITLPYNAFDLTVSYPLVQNTTRYFPLRRAVNSTQYTLGRAFLQEAYLTVDYHRQNFSVSQRLWSQTPGSSLVSIFPPPGTSQITGVTTSSSKIATSTIVGICAGVVTLLILASIAIYLRLRSRRLQRQEHADLATRLALEGHKEDINRDPYASGDVIHEAGTGKEPTELHAAHSFSEVDGSPSSESRLELAGVFERFELEAPHGQGELSVQRTLEVARDRSPLSSSTLAPPMLVTPGAVSPMTPEQNSWGPMGLGVADDIMETKSLREIKDEPKSLLSMKDLRGIPGGTPSSGPSSRGRD